MYRVFRPLSPPLGQIDIKFPKENGLFSHKLLLVAVIVAKFQVIIFNGLFTIAHFTWTVEFEYFPFSQIFQLFCNARAALSNNNCYWT